MDDELNKQIAYLKEQLSNQDKLASLGLLSAGIAHEIQNPLNFVINFSKLSSKLLKDIESILDDLGNSIPEDDREEIGELMDDLRCNMEKIEENGNRASSIVRGILLYSRGKDGEYMQTDLKQLTKEYIWLAYHAVRANNKSFNISIQENYEEDVPLVDVIPQDFSRAVLNIMNNACYAVFGKAKQASGRAYQPTVKVHLWREGEWVKLSIEDNGSGISQDVSDKLFNPFFTTKPVGEGTGLGLSITKTIIEENHQGKIDVDTREGEFTRFTVTLPINHKE